MEKILFALFCVSLLFSSYGCIDANRDAIKKDIEWCKGLPEYGGPEVCFDNESKYCSDVSPQRYCLLYMAVNKYNDSAICNEIPEGPLLGSTGSESHWVIEGIVNRTTCHGYFGKG